MNIGIPITKILCILIVSMPSFLQAKEDKVELINTDKHFIDTVVTLRKSAAIKDPFLILRAVSSGFKIERDFGGLYNPQVNSVVNFLAIFPLDEFDIKEEYQGNGWKKLKNILQSTIVIERSQINRCLPNGKYKNDSVQDEMLCFTKSKSGVWRISSFVNAGD